MSEPKVEVLVPAAEIKTSVSNLGQQISADYAGKNLTMLGVLTGSIVFLTDLMREVDLPLKLGLLQASSYRGETTEPGELQLVTSELPDVTGRDVLLVDDILDTGQTLDALLKLIEGQQPASVKSAVLLWKKCKTVAGIEPDYFCFEVPDQFVVGYGLDYDDSYRQLPFIGELHLG